MLPYIDCDCKKMLKSARKIAEKKRMPLVEIDELAEHSGFSTDEIYSIAEFLEERYVIKTDKDNYGHVCGIHMTQLGRHYTRYRCINFMSTFVFSIIVPIAVAVLSGIITTLITLSCSGMLQSPQ